MEVIYLKITKRKDPKHPIMVTLSDGTDIIIPRQGKFATKSFVNGR